MDKKRLTRTLAGISEKTLEALSGKVKDSGEITIIKEPAKTLTMVKMRDPVKNNLFYIGEVMVSEAIVEMNGVRGMAVTMGDDFDKVLNMAIIDCGFNNHLPVMQRIESELLLAEKTQQKMKEKENGMHMKTMVNFDVMSGGDA